MPPWSTPWSAPWSTAELAEPARAIGRHNAVAALLGAAGALVSVIALPGWRGASLALLPGVLLAIRLNLRPGGVWIRNLTLFALAAGFTELAADAWLVHGTGTLVYPPGEPRLWASPAYMPIAWFGLIGLATSSAVFFSRWLSRAGASVATVAVMGAYIPAYEAIAARAGWWCYVDTPMIGAVPLYIALGELLLALPLAVAMEALVRARAATAVALGVVEGAWIGASYWLAFQVAG